MIEPIHIAPEAAARFPDVRVQCGVATVAQSLVEDIQAVADQIWSAEHEHWSGVSRGDIRRHPNVAAYREFSTRLDIDPDRQAPSIQALIERGLRNKPLGAWPRINPIVDLLNATAVATMVALGVFDADRVHGPVRLRLTGEGEPFHALGAEQVWELEPGRLVFADDQRVLSLFSHRDGIHQAVTKDTTKVLVLGCMVSGIKEDAVTQAVDRAVRSVHGY